MTTEHRKGQEQGASFGHPLATLPDPTPGMLLDFSPKYPDQNLGHSQGRSANPLTRKDVGSDFERIRDMHREQSQHSTNKSLSRHSHPNSRERSPSPRREAQIILSVSQIEEMIRKGVAEKIAEVESKRAGTYTRPLDIEHGPLAPEIYEVSMAHLRFPDIPKFRGSGDTQDAQTFVHGFQEWFRLLGASDPITCRIFTTCFTGEVWEWYMKLP